MKPFKTEAELVSAMRKELVKVLGGDWTKIHGGPYQRVGVSDLLGCLNGRFIAVEVKLPGKEKTLTVSQKKFLDLINKNGGIGFMSSDIDYTIERLRGEQNNVKEKCKRK